MSNSAFKSSYFKNTKPERVAYIRNTNVVFDLNASTSFNVVPLMGSVDRIDDGYSISADKLIVTEAGWLELKSKVHMESDASATNVEIAYQVNGSVVEPRGNGCIINQGYGDIAGAELFHAFYADVGDEIEIVCRRTGYTGGVYMTSKSSYLHARRAPVVGLLSSADKRRTVWFHAEAKGTLDTGEMTFAFGDGSNGRANFGYPILRPCKLTRASLVSFSGTNYCNVEILVNGIVSGAEIVANQSQQQAVIEFTSPLQLSTGDRVNFRAKVGGGRRDVIVACELEIND